MENRIKKFLEGPSFEETIAQDRICGCGHKHCHLYCYCMRMQEGEPRPCRCKKCDCPTCQRIDQIRL